MKEKKKIPGSTAIPCFLGLWYPWGLCSCAWRVPAEISTHSQQLAYVLTMHWTSRKNNRQIQKLEICDYVFVLAGDLYSFSKILMISVCAADNLQKLKFPQFRIKSSLVTWRRFGFEKEFLFLYMQMRERMSQQNSQSKSAALLQLLNKICVLISHRENVKSRSTFGTMQDLCDF